MNSTHLGSIKGAVENKKVPVIKNVNLNDDSHTPQARFNLLSITKIM